MLWGQMTIWGHLGSRSGQGSCRSNDAMALVLFVHCHVVFGKKLPEIMRNTQNDMNLNSDVNSYVVV